MEKILYQAVMTPTKMIFDDEHSFNSWLSLISILS